MADDKQLQVLKQGVAAWNEWRRKQSGIVLDLRRADLRNADLRGAELDGAILNEAHLEGADLAHAQLGCADISGAHLNGADLRFANLVGADLRGADLSDANLQGARLSHARLNFAILFNAELVAADLIATDLSCALLRGARLNHASTYGTNFTHLDLRDVVGLEEVDYTGPSEVSLSTIYESEGMIPEVFLWGCGVPDEFITQIPALVAAIEPIQFYSCFISYSGKDDEFARRLHQRMRAAGLRVWFAPEDMKGGDKIYEQIDHAIQVHDRLLLVLSEHSLNSKWVETEIRRACGVERKETRRKLFPIRLVNFEALNDWVCLDAMTGEDLAEEVRRYFIPDFTNWKNHDEFEKAFTRLLADLKASA